jgi:uroporphyrinogen decarboxylase
VALLGFAGSPWTVASYLVEGGGGKGECAAIRRMARQDPETLALLLDRISEATVAYLRMQVEAGADAFQVFDTWGPLLAAPDYRALDLPRLRAIFAGLAGTGVPGILYAGGAPHQWADAARSGAAALSVDHRVPLDEVRAAVGAPVALQGNLDPAVLFAPRERIAAEAARVLRAGGPRGTVFNLGHGIWPETPPEAVAAMLEAVRAEGTRICAEAAATGAPAGGRP